MISARRRPADAVLTVIWLVSGEMVMAQAPSVIHKDDFVYDGGVVALDEMKRIRAYGFAFEQSDAFGVRPA